MSHPSFVLLLVGFTAALVTGCAELRTHAGQADAFFVPSVRTDHLSDKRVAVVLSDAAVPEVIESGWIDIWMLTGNRRVVREALLMSLAPAVDVLEFTAEEPAGGYEILLRPQLEVSVRQPLLSRTYVEVRLGIRAEASDGKSIGESEAVTRQKFQMPGNWPRAYRFALRRASQEVIPSVAQELDQHFAR
jgi:hypothetical protein